MNQDAAASVEAFSDRLQAAMDAQGLRNKDLAEMLGASPSAVSRWLNDNAMPDRPTMHYLASRLGVPLDWLQRGRRDLDVAQRNPLRIARTRAGLSIKQLAKATGYSAGVLEAVENGARASEKMIEKIVAALPGFAKEDFMSGSDSPMILQESGMEGTYGAKPKISLPPGTSARYVPLLSFAQAGQYDLNHTDEAYTGDGVLAIGVDDSKAFAVEIDGNSMSPQLEPGDRVIVAPSWTPRAGDTVIARTVDGDVFCKLFTRQSGGKLVLVSVNVNHPPITLSPEEIVWIYPVAQVTKNLRRR